MRKRRNTGVTEDSRQSQGREMRGTALARALGVEIEGQRFGRRERSRKRDPGAVTRDREPRAGTTGRKTRHSGGGRAPSGRMGCPWVRVTHQGSLSGSGGTWEDGDRAPQPGPAQENTESLSGCVCPLRACLSIWEHMPVPVGTCVCLSSVCVSCPRVLVDTDTPGAPTSLCTALDTAESLQSSCP